MRLSLDWLNDYVARRSLVDDLVWRLIMTTAEVEAIIPAPLPIQTGLVAEIINIEPHPQADRLVLVTVKTSKNTVKVVCGANNIAIGNIVPFIPVGASYQTENGEIETLKKAVIRGVESQGMLASSRDLGLSPEHDGILILPAHTPLSRSLAEVIGWKDPVLDLEITPNRGDLLSYLGLAREIALIEKSRLQLPRVTGIDNHHDDSLPRFKVAVKTPLCHRYSALMVSGVINKPSPFWLANRLRLNNIKPINIIVDVTNYVMLELGQPLHAFDFHKLSQNKKVEIIIKEANKDESITALDGNTYDLTSKDMVIANSKEVVAIAGVIGGEAAAIDEDTTGVIIESAVFDPVSVRRTANRIGLRTEAVTRFEKGIDPEVTIVALKRAAELLVELGEGTVSGRLIDHNPHRQGKQHLDISLERAKKILGIKFDRSVAKSQLSRLGFQIAAVNQNTLTLIVPSWRLDVSSEEDIFEELIRVFGYDQITPTLPSGDLPASPLEPIYYQEMSLRDYLARCGLREVVSQAFMSQDLLNRYGISAVETVEIKNPTSRNEQYLRSAIAPLLSERAFLQSRSQNELKSFEIGHAFTWSKGKPTERPKLGLAFLTADPIDTARFAKGILEGLPKALGVKGKIKFESSDTAYSYLSEPSEKITFNDLTVGQLGILRPEIVKRGKLRGERYILMVEINLQPLVGAELATISYQPPSKYPESIIGLTVEVGSNQSLRDLTKVIKAAKPKNLKEVDISDIYTKPDIRVVTIKLTFQSSEGTLNEASINKEVAKIKAALAKESFKCLT